MDANELARLARDGIEPDAMSPAMRVLWLDARGDWDAAHEVAQDMPDPEGALLHAYLHRKEGDLANAGYWYRRAGSSMPNDELVSEWRRLADRFSQ